MPDDFYINYRGAYSWINKVHYTPAKPQGLVNSLPPLLARLIQSQTELDEIHSCPTCGGKLHIRFKRQASRPTTLDISTHCENRNILVLFESNKVPSWTKVVNLLDKLRKLKRKDPEGK